MNLSQLKPQICGIYKFYNTITERVYIGQSIDIEARWHQHVKDFISGKHINKKMLADFQLHGLQSFEAEILEQCDRQLLDAQETYWASFEIKDKLYNNTKSLKGYYIKGGLR